MDLHDHHRRSVPRPTPMTEDELRAIESLARRRVTTVETGSAIDGTTLVTVRNEDDTVLRLIAEIRRLQHAHA
jgi:hypothetical protein